MRFETIKGFLKDYKTGLIFGVVFVVAACIDIFVVPLFDWKIDLFPDNNKTEIVAEEPSAVISTQQEKKRKATLAAFNSEYINTWLLVDCTSKPYKPQHISCNNPAVVGSGVSHGIAAWFNICNVTEKAIFVVSAKGKCTELIRARPGKSAKEITVGYAGIANNNDLRKIYRIPKNDKYASWDSSRAQIVNHEEVIKSQASAFGSPMRSVFLAFYNNRFWPVYVLFFISIFFVWVGSKTKAEADGGEDDAAVIGWFYVGVVALVSFYIFLVNASFEKYAELIIWSERDFYSAVDVINSHYRHALDSGFDGASPLGGGYLSTITNYTIYTGYGKYFWRDFISGFFSFTWVFLFIPIMIFFYAINAKNFVVGVVEVFGSSRHKDGFAGARKILPTVDEVTNSFTDFITAPFSKVYADMLTRKNRRKAAELKAREKEIESDIEVSEAERDFMIRKQYIDKLKAELEGDRKGFYGKEKGQRRKRD